MNKSILTLVLVLSLFCLFLSAENEREGKIRLGVHIGYFSFNDSNENIEPLNPEFLNGIFYGADAGFMITKNIELEVSYTRIYEENDVLSITPIMPAEATFDEWSLGGYYHFMGICEPINIKVGAGVDYCTLFAELIGPYGEVLDLADQNGIGFWISAGVETSIADLFNVGVEAIYLSLKTEDDDPGPDDEPVDIGGIRIKGFVKIRL
jgi:outer membrane protein W